MVPLTQLEIDLRSADTTPNFAWFQADEEHAGEGPLDIPFGLLSFVLSQLTDHQYNVAASDEFLQDTLPIIMNSPVWQDPIQKSAIFITFDETTTTCRWASATKATTSSRSSFRRRGAVAAGMRGGAFVASDHYDHYSLLRTIEDSLGLRRLTNNDTYAQPLNEFFT